MKPSGMNRKKKLVVVLFCITAAPLFGDTNNAGLEGYAGPGWSVLFGSGGTGGVSSLGPVMFRLDNNMYCGPVISYEESASEGPGTFLGGVRLEGYIRKLSRGFYSTSAALSVMAGGGNLNTETRFAGQINMELNANMQILPALTLGAGPLISLKVEAGKLNFLYGFTFLLKESTPLEQSALIRVKDGGLRVSGYWQGLWTAVNNQFVFIDGGGTRLEFPNGLAFGITGGVLRQRVEENGSALAIMLSGVTAGWNYHFTSWFTLTPRVTAGVALYGWAGEDGTMDGGPHFMIRPELSAFFGILPFMELGGGVGYHVIAGKGDTEIPLEQLSSAAFSIQVRVGHR